MRVLFLFIKCFAFLQFISVRADHQNGIFPKQECSSVSSSGVICKSSVSIYSLQSWILLYSCFFYASSPPNVLQVSIKCTYIDDGGDERSCLAKNDYSYFLYEEEDKCGDIFATITMTICNDNTEGNKSIMPWEKGTSFVFAGKQLDSTTLFDRVLEPGQCHTITSEQTLNTCNKYPKYWAMSVQLKGNMPDISGSNYCSCRLHRRSYVKKIEAIKTRPTKLSKHCELTHNNGNICNAEVRIWSNNLDVSSGSFLE